MNSAEKIPADVAFLNAPTERLEGVLRHETERRRKQRRGRLQITEEHCQEDEEIRKNVEDRDQKRVRELDVRGHRRGPPPDGRGRQAS
ncbi:hypothetical protein HHI36_004155 [Cryptolaemus montrouzieri]|uniref:Uncharacterized protein n=1 Tax=Cryptolaemus montrouzieri TaxID=559131 RepID=A0ABD2NQT8_9CUCU